MFSHRTPSKSLFCSKNLSPALRIWSWRLICLGNCLTLRCRNRLKRSQRLHQLWALPQLPQMLCWTHSWLEVSHNYGAWSTLCKYLLTREFWMFSSQQLQAKWQARSYQLQLSTLSTSTLTIFYSILQLSHPMLAMMSRTKTKQRSSIRHWPSLATKNDTWAELWAPSTSLSSSQRLHSWSCGYSFPSSQRSPLQGRLTTSWRNYCCGTTWSAWSLKHA